MRRTLCTLASILFIAACVSEPKKRPAALDPSNPDAPEAPVASQPTAFAAPSSQVPVPSHAREGGDHAQHAASTPDAGVTIYTCPMHPEVRSTQPGTCPKCGMTLVPEKPTGPGAADAGQSGSMPPGHHHGGHP